MTSFQHSLGGYEKDNLTLFEELLRENKPIYVLNNTEPKGLLSMTIHDPISGKAREFEIPRTWIPFCLTSMLPRNVLEHNIELRRTMENTVLKIIPEERALELLNSEKGRKEYSRLRVSIFAGGAHQDSKQKASLVNAVRSSQQAVASLDNPNVNYDEVALHPKMRAWEQRIVVGEIDGAALINELETHREELTGSDLQFLITGQFPQDAKAFAQEILSAGNIRTKAVTTAIVGSAAPAEKYESDWDIEVK